jgi:type I restriction enzyme, S subunit
MSDWPTARLGDLTVKIGSGATPRGGSTVYEAEGAVFIRSQNVLDNRLVLDKAVRLSGRAARALNGVSVEPADVLINITGDSVARCAIAGSDIGPARVNQHVAIIRPNNRLCPGFLQRVLVAQGMKAHLLSLSRGGGTRKALTKADLSELKIPVPPLSLQQSIAEVLESLDDKIVVNLRVGRLAIALADFKFAVAAGSAAMSSDSFADHASIGGGGTPSTKVAEFWGGRVPWATPTDVTGLPGPYLQDTARHLTAEGLESCASPLYPEGSILMTSRATIGAFAVLTRPCAVNQGFIVVRPRNERLRWWLFHEMRRRVPEFISHANGATFLELSRGEFKKFRVHLAAEAVMKKFCVDAAAIHGTAQAAHQENVKLAELRDALLPGLMSGRIKVKDAEDRVGEML